MFEPHLQRSFITRLTAVLLFIILVSIAFKSEAQQKQWSLSYTPDGQPDLQGVYANNTVIPLQRNTQFGDQSKFSDEEYEVVKQKVAELLESDGDALFGDIISLAYAGNTKSYDPSTGNYDQSWMSERTIENRTSLIFAPVNGRIPATTASYKDSSANRAKASRERREQLGRFASYVDFPLQERCITYGMPYLNPGYNSTWKIVQSGDYVVIIQEMIHETRVIPLFEKEHLHENIRSWNGDSRGWWEGDTLVIETTNFSKQSNFMGARENRTLIERISKIEQDKLQYIITLEDPTVWTASWSAQYNLEQLDSDIYEYACHEGNYAMPAMLRGARYEESQGAANEEN